MKMKKMVKKVVPKKVATKKVAPQKKIKKSGSDLEKFAAIVVGEIGSFRAEFNEFRDEMYTFKDEMYAFRDEMYEFRDEMYEFRDWTKTEIAYLREEVRDIRARLTALEEQVKNHSGYSKEIDVLLSRVAAIEKHLGMAHA